MSQHYILLIFNNISLLLTKNEKIYICGNFNQREKQNIINSEEKDDKEKNDKNKKKVAP